VALVGADRRCLGLRGAEFDADGAEFGEGEAECAENNSHDKEGNGLLHVRCIGSLSGMVNCRFGMTVEGPI